MVAMAMKFDLLPQYQGLYHWSLSARPRGGEIGEQHALQMTVNMVT